eukprot:TRINITY_DN2790_c0_g1_i7.p1 TRINITY_DN2790_c0_g1~~TRINITY_DN2790_c0_g1_i7.p1  ORF type:complete len:428 (-),score=102.17 TRINITY_DN2790_c0_g1_i7:95-1378(-)
MNQGFAVLSLIFLSFISLAGLGLWSIQLVQVSDSDSEFGRARQVVREHGSPFAAPAVVETKFVDPRVGCQAPFAEAEINIDKKDKELQTIFRTPSIRQWRGQTLCARYVVDYKYKSIDSECQSGYKQCSPILCVRGKNDCPLDDENGRVPDDPQHHPAYMLPRPTIGFRLERNADWHHELDKGALAESTGVTLETREQLAMMFSTGIPILANEVNVSIVNVKPTHVMMINSCIGGVVPRVRTLAQDSTAYPLVSAVMFGLAFVLCQVGAGLYWLVDAKDRKNRDVAFSIVGISFVLVAGSLGLRSLITNEVRNNLLYLANYSTSSICFGNTDFDRAIGITTTYGNYPFLLESDGYLMVGLAIFFVVYAVAAALTFFFAKKKGAKVRPEKKEQLPSTEAEQQYVNSEEFYRDLHIYNDEIAKSCPQIY